ncbi:Arsenate reductase and related proteins, glutaredoxin family [Nocardia otitidiscaviarum]|uniref:Arsenate reductase and related proteins, glutaredoxin family n=1 Tax=Nocardia otitidiscaviarum TaxID=1823 RepID=A0A378YM51_9NOCA|nr:carboxymuconolactone decarboxylase family protein [Nocardia otitidiscaviarum]MBF6241262.1 carboxymuconolactone decarboxylase family protein [Nocardia otitidiscaviarum]SUA78194.1 Arsenate reductase and related proteins, glutaredoxin family [Nocardia otitidiscaviarum]
MGSTRIPTVTPQQAGLLTRIAYRYSKRRFGEVPEPFAVLANHPKLMRAAGVHETMVEKASTQLPAAVREIAVFRVASTVGCSWCVDFGTMLMKHSDLDIDKLQHIDEFATSPHYSADERAAIAYADAMTATPPTVTDEQVTDLKRRFGTAGVMELTYQIALENSRSRTYHALGITDQGFSRDACRVPWARD